jgi:hypothetical protein
LKNLHFYIFKDNILIDEFFCTNINEYDIRKTLKTMKDKYGNIKMLVSESFIEDPKLPEMKLIEQEMYV